MKHIGLQAIIISISNYFIDIIYPFFEYVNSQKTDFRFHVENIKKSSKMSCCISQLPCKRLNDFLLISLFTRPVIRIEN